jgi:hypothetical protein
MPAIYRRGVEAEIFADDPPHSVQLPNRYPRKWHGNRYRFIQRYRSGQPETLGEEFDAPFTRLDWISRDRFDIQWHRHTGTWFCLHRGLSLVEALKTIESDGLLHPL